MGISAQSPILKDSVEVHRTDTIYFDFGRADIRPQSDSVIAKLRAAYYDGLELYLEGHTDAVGSTQANERLARRRALNVRDRITTLGWPDSTISMRVFGERKLLVATSAREEKNRRVFLRSGKPQRYRLYRGTVTDSTGNPLPAGVIAHGRYLRDTTVADANGQFEIWLPINQVVGLDIYAPGHFFFSQYFRVDPNKPTDFSIALESAEVGRRMDIPDMYFVGNKPILLDRSKGALPRLLTFMEYNPELRIEIAGHVNYPGRKKGPGTWEWNLAESRAHMVRNYLIANGVVADRLVARGYSNHEMRFPQPKNPKEQEANRRVEIRIIE